MHKHTCVPLLLNELYARHEVLLDVLSGIVIDHQVKVLNLLICEVPLDPLRCHEHPVYAFALQILQVDGRRFGAKINVVDYVVSLFKFQFS